MDSHEVSCYLKAGRAAARALREAYRRVHEGAPIKEICEAAERAVREAGAEPAFPCNVSINNVAAHYTAVADDELTIPKGAVVKVDVGAHVDGYIGDAAATVSLSPAWDPLVKAAEEALRRSLEYMKPGAALSNVGWAIEASIRSYGFKPIRNLTGHGLARYTLHTGVMVPNVRAGEGVVEEGAAYAVEPFATNGAGRVVDGEEAVIFSYVGAGKVRDKDAKRLLEVVWERFKSLPFTERWLIDGWGVRRVRELLKLLVEGRALHPYHVLLEGGGGMVSQFECTVVVAEGEVVVTTPYEWVASV
jgi:methionyl aminopeptidase